jgi:hypothetical protein
LAICNYYHGGEDEEIEDFIGSFSLVDEIPKLNHFKLDTPGNSCDDENGYKSFLFPSQLKLVATKYEKRHWDGSRDRREEREANRIFLVKFKFVNGTFVVELDGKEEFLGDMDWPPGPLFTSDRPVLEKFKRVTFPWCEMNWRNNHGLYESYWKFEDST